MAPSANPTTGHLDWSVAKEVCSAVEIERLACAFLNSDDISKFDAKTAAAQFGTEAKPESFRRYIANTAKKIKEASSGDGSGGGKDAAAKGKGKGGQKRKAADDDDGADANAQKKTQSKKAKGGKRGKKVQADTPVGSDNESQVGDAAGAETPHSDRPLKMEEE